MLDYSCKVGESLVFALVFFGSVYIESSELARAVYDGFRNSDRRALCFLAIFTDNEDICMQAICMMAITIKSSKVIKI